MQVVVVGGGIGGLTCAQGLVRRGIDVRVVERDHVVSRTAGYKLHLGAAAVAALRDVLDGEGTERLLASAVATRGFSLVVRDHRARRLLRAAEDADDVSLDIDRTTLRTLLASGLEDRLLLARFATGWHRTEHGVALDLDDGTRVEGDVLVIADGAGSAAAARLAGGPTSSPCGLVGVAGRTPWDALPIASREVLTHEPLLAVGPGGTGLFATAHDPAARAALRADPADGRPAPEAVAIWGLMAPEGHLPGPGGDHGRGLLADAGSLMRHQGWSPVMTDLLEHADPGSVAAFVLHAADPTAIAPWPASRVTALGDAVHAMPPTGGQGAATAILDARDLVDRLAHAHLGTTTVATAVHDYEAVMRPRAARAVRESLQPVGWIRAGATPLGSATLRALTPVAARVAAGASTLRRERRR